MLFSIFAKINRKEKGEFMLDELNVTRNLKDFNKWVPDAW